MDEFLGLWTNVENNSTETSQMQCSCEQNCAQFLKPLGQYAQEIMSGFRKKNLINENKEIRLLKEKHAQYLERNIRHLSINYVSLDASRPWIVYWIMHACYLLSCQDLLRPLHTQIIDTLAHFQAPSGGFGGGPMQLPHGAPNYGCVMSLLSIGTPEAYATIDRAGMLRYLLSMKHPCGGFMMHTDGEVDARGTYTALAVARLLNILHVTPELTAGVASFLLACQTYEGGFGGEPGNEAHGGYNFCALAALHILGKADQCDMRAQEYWLAKKQMRLEGGYQGRTNKLVDSCYSYWQGAAAALLNMILRGGSDISDCDGSFTGVRAMGSSSAGSGAATGGTAEAAAACPAVVRSSDRGGEYRFNQHALQRYVLHCAQDVDEGGLRDKPGKPRDFYHSCYALSGLSVAQHSDDIHGQCMVYGDAANLLEPTSIVFNISKRKVMAAVEHFGSLPPLRAGDFR